MIDIPLPYQRKTIGRLVFSFLFIFLFYRFWVNATPSNLLGPPLKALNFDFTYWIYNILGLHNSIIHNQTGAAIFDILLFTSCILCIVFPLKNGFALVFGICIFLYALTYNTVILSHSHPLAIPMLITIPFFFKQNKNWKILWEGMRYYICYVYTISFVWKVFIGKSFFDWNMGVKSVKLNLVEYMYHFPNTVTTSFLSYLIAHPAILNIGHIIIILLEGIMVIGFFTKKYDRILMIIPIIIHGATYLATDVFFMEMLVGIFTFLSLKDLEVLKRKIPLLVK